MAKRCKGLNSKCFLFTYLIIVGFILVLWMNKLPLMQEETRDIPTEMQQYITSPARHLPSFSLNTVNKLALTNDWFSDKWTFVTFTHSHCLPHCQDMLSTLSDLTKAFASNNTQFLFASLDTNSETIDGLSQFISDQQLIVTPAVGSSETIEQLTKAFIALFLQTDYSDGSYIIEQEYVIFLVDPKGRVYASFNPPYSATSIKTSFFKLRRFYARTE